MFSKKILFWDYLSNLSPILLARVFCPVRHTAPSTGTINYCVNRPQLMFFLYRTPDLREEWELRAEPVKGNGSENNGRNVKPRDENRTDASEWSITPKALTL